MIVTRRYANYVISQAELDASVGSSAMVTNGSLTWVEVSYDDATAGITEALDEFMAQYGLVYDDDAGKGGVRVRYGTAGDPVDVEVDSIGNVRAEGFQTPNIGTYDCDPAIAVNDVVYLSASDTVDKADATDDTKAAIGVVVHKFAGGTSCLVRYNGGVGGFAGLTPGATYYLATVAGTITDVPPIVIGNIVQKIGFARNATTLVLMVDRNWSTII